MTRLTKLAALGASWTLLFASSSAQACGVCMGQTDGSQVGGAINGAIFVMLGFLGLMLAGISGVAFSLWRRAKNTLPQHLEFADIVGAQSTSK
ncbi:hypothetical protein ACXR0O_06135 [Verrucomicrobiota bacterium sgz303538]